MSKRGASSRIVVDVGLWILSVGLVAGAAFFSIGSKAGPSGDLEEALFHAAAYASITASFLLAAVWRPGRGAGPFPAGALPVAAGTVAAGVILELLQGLTEDRTPDLLDAGANVVGAIVAFLVWAFLRRSLRS